MVNQLSALGRSGVFDWFCQRLSALIVLSYVLFVTFFVLMHSPLTYDNWSQLFGYRGMRVFTVLVALAIVVHAWVGLWAILMDYVKCSLLRLFLKSVIVVSLGVELIWLIDLLWG